VPTIKLYGSTTSNAMALIKICEESFSTPAENLACDEVLLDAAEAGTAPQTLRFWEAGTPFVVVGYGNHLGSEVQVDFCNDANIPIFRRCSGGGTVLQNAGVLNYALILHGAQGSPLQSIHAANEFIMEKNREVLERLVGKPIELNGFTDLSQGGRKFSGNAQRRRKNYFLFHGSLLLNADLELIEKTLKMPSKKPAYRNGRAHRDFLVNLGVPSADVQAVMCEAWGAGNRLENVPLEEISRLAEERYSRDEWNRKFV
jgi:lipoate-protein ligase A